MGGGGECEGVGGVWESRRSFGDVSGTQIAVAIFSALYITAILVRFGVWYA